MKRFIYACAAVFFILSMQLSAQEAAAKPEENAVKTEESKSDSGAVKGGQAEVPAAKRPAAPDSEKAAAAAAKDESPDTEQENRDTLKYGVPSEIAGLISTLIANEDPRYADDLYDIFKETKSTAVRNKILEYFTKLKDPCLEDYGVTVLNDPYDTDRSTVSDVFDYIAAVKCTAAIPAVVNLIETDNSDYFDEALSCLGDIGGPKEAVYLSGYLDDDDLSLAQKQALMRVLGKINAVETWDKLAEIAQDTNENTFVRMYAAESIGEMKKTESVPILEKLYGESDPNLRQYVIKGLSNYPDNKQAVSVIVQGIRDDYWKVRVESIQTVKKNSMKDAVPYLIYRAKNDKENAVKNECYPAIAEMDTAEGNKFLIEQLTAVKTADGVRAKAADALLNKGDAGTDEICTLAKACLKDDKRKDLRNALGKSMAKYNKPQFAEVCSLYLQSKDATTVSLGLDMYRSGKYETTKDAVQKIAEDPKSGANGKRARKMLKIEEKAAEQSDAK